MALTLSPALKKAALDSGLGPAFDTTGVIKIYTGTKPATADMAPTGTLLGTLTLSADAFAAAAGTSAVSITANAITSDTSADASGTAGWFRVQLTGDLGTTNTTDKRLDGTITATGSGGDMTLDNVNIVAGGVIACSSFVITQPG